MILTLNGNRLPFAALAAPLSSFFSQEHSFVLCDIEVKTKWEEGKNTGVFAAIVYTISVLETHSLIKIKVTDSATPVITREELLDADSDVSLDLDLDKIIVKPYGVERRELEVSIQSPAAAIALSR